MTNGRCRARSRSLARSCSARSASKAFLSTTSRMRARRAVPPSTSRCRASRRGRPTSRSRIGAEKMNIPDKAKAFSIFDGGWDVSRAEENYQTLVAMGEGVEVRRRARNRTSRTAGSWRSTPRMCRYHMKTYGTTQRQIAAVSAKNHMHSVHNPLFATPQAVHDRRSARGTPDHLPADAAHVRAAI